MKVAPDASAGEIRTAYRAAAQRHHPDKAPEGARRAAAVHEMAKINAAWAVLSDRTKRENYDRELARNAQASTAAGPPSSAQPRTGPAASTPYDSDYYRDPVFDESMDVFPESERVRAPIAVAGLIPAVALAVALLAIFVFTAYAGGPTSNETPNSENRNMVAVRDIRGQCIQQNSGFILVVNCALTPNEGRIVAQASLGAQCPNNTQGWVIRQQQVQACVDPATSVP